MSKKIHAEPFHKILRPLISLKNEAGEKVGEGKEGGPATKLFFHSVGAVELVNEAALIEFFHELSIDQVFRLQSGRGGILQLHQALDVAETFEGGKRFSVRGLKQILIASHRKCRIANFQASRDGL
jgi:hypothetical protein